MLYRGLFTVHGAAEALGACRARHLVEPSMERRDGAPEEMLEERLRVAAFALLKAGRDRLAEIWSAAYPCRHWRQSWRCCHLALREIPGRRRQQEQA